MIHGRLDGVAAVLHRVYKIGYSRRSKIIGASSTALLMMLTLSVLSGCVQPAKWKYVQVSNVLRFGYREVDLGIPVNLNSVSMASRNLGWLAGSHGTVYRCEGGAWKRVSIPLPPNADVTSVFALKGGGAWFASTEHELSEGSNDDKIINSSNGKFNVISVASQIRSIFMLSKDLGWAGGTGLLLRYDGPRWVGSSFPTQQSINSVFFQNANLGWAVAGQVYQYKDSLWTALPDVPYGQYITVYNSPNGHLLIGGGDVLLDRTENGVREIDGFIQKTIQSITSGPSNSTVLVGGNSTMSEGRIMFVVDGKKVAVEIDFDRALWSISADSIDHGWICGNYGRLIEYKFDK